MANILSGNRNGLFTLPTKPVEVSATVGYEVIASLIKLRDTALRAATVNTNANNGDAAEVLGQCVLVCRQATAKSSVAVEKHLDDSQVDRSFSR